MKGDNNSAGHCIITKPQNKMNGKKSKKMRLEVSIKEKNHLKAESRIAQLSLQCHAGHASRVLMISLCPPPLSVQ